MCPSVIGSHVKGLIAPHIDAFSELENPLARILLLFWIVGLDSEPRSWALRAAGTLISASFRLFVELHG